MDDQLQYFVSHNEAWIFFYNQELTSGESFYVGDILHKIIKDIDEEDYKMVEI